MSRPNFVVVMTDTQATNIVGCYGHPDLRTPCIDRLAEQGVRFDRAYTTCPVCTPARAAMFTGIHAHTAGPWTNNLALGDNIVTMGTRFADAGYHTAYIGKWHLDGHDYFGTGICPPGWDPAYWYDGKRYMDELTPEQVRMWRQELNSIDDLRRNDITAEFTWAHRIGDRAEHFLQNRRDDSPFLMVVSYDEPHHPFTCPPEFVEPFVDYRYDLGPQAFDGLDDKPEHQREWADNGRYRVEDGQVHFPMYFGCNSFVDHEIGRVIDAVDRWAPEDTWVVFTSDHGELMGAHQLVSKGPVMYEEITHVPFVVRRPDGSGAGSADTTELTHIDLLPTMMELAGMDRPPILEGDSLASVLTGQRANVQRDIVMEFNRYEIEHDSWGGFQPVRCLLRWPWKLVVNLLHTDELYNLDDDPSELTNRIGDESVAEVRNDMHASLIDWMNDKRDPFRGPCWERRPWYPERRLKWKGGFRVRPDDGYAPQVLDYDTGFPSTGLTVYE